MSKTSGNFEASNRFESLMSYPRSDDTVYIPVKQENNCHDEEPEGQPRPHDASFYKKRVCTKFVPNDKYIAVVLVLLTE
jgi:hypothetical protein